MTPLRELEPCLVYTPGVAQPLRELVRGLSCLSNTGTIWGLALLLLGELGAARDLGSNRVCCPTGGAACFALECMETGIS